MVRLRRDPMGRTLEAQSGGGCVGCIGIAFALQASLLGGMMIMGWRSGDFAGEDRLVLTVFGAFVGTFFFCGLGVGTYRCRYRFDMDRQAVTHISQVFFLPYRWDRWSLDDFKAVELWLYLRRKDNVTSRIHVIRLLPAEESRAPAEPRELGSGGAGKEMRAVARTIADFTGLPLREPPVEKQ